MRGAFCGRRWCWRVADGSSNAKKKANYSITIQSQRKPHNHKTHARLRFRAQFSERRLINGTFLRPLRRDRLHLPMKVGKVQRVRSRWEIEARFQFEKLFIASQLRFPRTASPPANAKFRPALSLPGDAIPKFLSLCRGAFFGVNVVLGVLCV